MLTGLPKLFYEKKTDQLIKNMLRCHISFYIRKSTVYHTNEKAINLRNDKFKEKSKLVLGIYYGLLWQFWCLYLLNLKKHPRVESDHKNTNNLLGSYLFWTKILWTTTYNNHFEQIIKALTINIILCFNITHCLSTIGRTLSNYNKQLIIVILKKKLFLFFSEFSIDNSSRIAFLK